MRVRLGRAAAQSLAGSGPQFVAQLLGSFDDPSTELRREFVEVADDAFVEGGSALVRRHGVEVVRRQERAICHGPTLPRVTDRFDQDNPGG